MRKRIGITFFTILVLLSSTISLAAEPVIAISNNKDVTTNGGRLDKGGNDKSKENNLKSILQKSVDRTNTSLPNNAVSVSVNTPDTFQTYIDPITQIGPTELNVSLSVSISQAIAAGKAQIELPYSGFNPGNGDEVFKNFEMTEPIFSFIEPEAPDEKSIVSSYENDVANQKIIIHLKDVTPTVETLNLRFKYNENYNAKIPGDQVIWNDIQAKVIDTEDDTVISQSTTKTIKSNATDGMRVNLDYGNPVDSNYVSGKIELVGNSYNNYNLHSLLDTTKNNRLFIEVPTGMTSSAIGGYYSSIGETNSENSQVPVGYTRYYRNMTDDSKSFNFWNRGGNPNTNYNYAEMAFTVPSSINEGDNFHILIGMTYTKINGEEITKISKRDFTKVEQLDWAISKGSTTHQQHAGDPINVNTSLSNSVSNAITTFGLTKYGFSWTFRNIGKRDVVNSDFVIYQKNTGSEKLNFNRIYVRGFRESNEVDPTYWKVKFEIKDALTDEVREISNAPQFGDFYATLPALGANEYIDKVHLIPMGIDGNTEGHLTSLNGIGVQYSAKNWPNNKWPDGTPVPNDKRSLVQMGAQKYYDDETNDQTPKPTVIEQNTGTFYYLPGQTTDARAQFVSGNAVDRKPGEIVNYVVQGYNERGALGVWTNPEIVVSIPKILELQDPSAYKDYIDEKNNQVYPSSVKVSLVSSDDDFNYYKFKANNIGYLNEAKLSFSIPVTFKVKSGASVGTYPIKATTASHNEPSFVQRTMTTNNLVDETAEKMGHDNKVENSYSAYTTGNSPVNVVYATKLNGSTAGRKNENDNWSNISNFAVEKGGRPQMKATIQNEGNTSFSSVRLYDILPSLEDNRGSTGQISFGGLESVAGAKIYYTTKPVADLPDYETNLQEWDTTKLASYGFTTTQPTDISKVTAIFIDFGNTLVEPNSSLNTVLDFLIPNADNQKAINQFQYSAKEEGSGTILNAKSDSITFSTEVAQINFNENLPAFLADGVEHASRIPESQSELLDVFGQGLITISSDIPTLPGYTFDKWVDKDDSSKSYQPGDIVYFDKTSPKTTIDLQAVWKAKNVNVTYNDNFGTTPNTAVKKYDFGDSINLADVTEPTRPGYEFLGWSSSDVATEPDFDDGTKVDFVTDKTVYAVWKVNNYKITFDANGGTGSMADQVMTYDISDNLSENKFTRSGYIFQGWATTKGGSVKYQDQDEVTNLVSDKDGEFKLYAVWKEDLTAIKVKDSTLYVGDNWDPKDNFVSATDVDGNDVKIENITLPNKNEVDTSTVGEYKVTYSYEGETAVATITVLPDLRTIKGDDFTMYVGDSKPTVSDFKASATDKDGKDLTVTADFTDVDFDKPGVYDVILKASDGQEKTVELTIKEDKTSIKGDDFTMYIGDSKPTVNDFKASATDKDGKDLTVTTDFTDVDFDKPGVYDVTLKASDGQEKTVKLTIKEDKTAIKGEDFTIYVGDPKPTVNDFKASATDKDGKDLTVTAGFTDVDFDKPGVYDVTLKASDGQEKTVKLTIKEDKTAIKGDDFTMYVGDPKPTVNDFKASATDKDGKDLTVTVDFTDVDFDKPGVYDVILKASDGQELIVELTIKGNKTAIKGEDFTMYVGDPKPTVNDFKASATDEDGKDLTVTADFTGVDFDTPGVYDVILKASDGQEKTVKLTIKEDKTSIKGDDFTMYVGDPKPTVNDFKASATDKDGKDLTVTADFTGVDFDIPGVYDVTLKASDGQDKIVKLTVKAISYNIAFDSNGGEGTMSNLQVVDNGKVNLTTNSFTRENYAFIGWSTTRNGKVKYQDGQEVFELTKKNNDTVTLYAIWEKIPAADVTIEHVDEQGNKLAPDITLSGYLGETFVTPEPMAIRGYTFKAGIIKAALTGTFTSKPQTISFVYVKNPEVKDPVGKEPVKLGTKTTITTKTVKINIKALPKTGEDNFTRNTLIIFGFAILIVLGLSKLNRRKED